MSQLRRTLSPCSVQTASKNFMIILKDSSHSSTPCYHRLLWTSWDIIMKSVIPFSNLSLSWENIRSVCNSRKSSRYSSNRSSSNPNRRSSSVHRSSSPAHRSTRKSSHQTVTHSSDFKQVTKDCDESEYSLFTVTSASSRKPFFVTVSVNGSTLCIAKLCWQQSTESRWFAPEVLHPVQPQFRDIKGFQSENLCSS